MGIPILGDVPQEFTAGDTVKWAKSFSDYLFSAGWRVTYYFANASDNFEIEGIAYQTDSHEFDLISSLTDGKAAGEYNYNAYAELGTDRVTVDFGKTKLRADFSAGGNVDSRSIVKQTLDALDAMILKKASRDQQDVEIVGRKVKTFTPGELIAWRSTYAAMYKSECDADAVAKGEGSGRRLTTRFIK